MEPPISGNIAQLLSLSARAMQQREEMFHDQSFYDVGSRGGADRRTGFANAQGAGMGRESGGAAAQQSAPSGNSAAPSNRQATEPSGSSSGMKGAQSEKSSTVGQSQRGEENAHGSEVEGHEL